MKYYSVLLNKIFDTVDELEAAESEHNKEIEEVNRKKQERKARAQEVDEAFKHYQTLLNNFVKDYGSYHISYNDKDLQEFFNFLRITC